MNRDTYLAKLIFHRGGFYRKFSKELQDTRPPKFSEGILKRWQHSGLGFNLFAILRKCRQNEIYCKWNQTNKLVLEPREDVLVYLKEFYVTTSQNQYIFYLTFASHAPYREYPYKMYHVELYNITSFKYY